MQVGVIEKRKPRLAGGRDCPGWVIKPSRGKFPEMLGGTVSQIVKRCTTEPPRLVGFVLIRLDIHTVTRKFEPLGNPFFTFFATNSNAARELNFCILATSLALVSNKGRHIFDEGTLIVHARCQETHV